MPLNRNPLSKQDSSGSEAMFCSNEVAHATRAIDSHYKSNVMELACSLPWDYWSAFILSNRCYCVIFISCWITLYICFYQKFRCTAHCSRVIKQTVELFRTNIKSLRSTAINTNSTVPNHDKFVTKVINRLTLDNGLLSISKPVWYFVISKALEIIIHLFLSFPTVIP